MGVFTKLISKYQPSGDKQIVQSGSKGNFGQNGFAWGDEDLDYDSEIMGENVKVQVQRHREFKFFDPNPFTKKKN